MTINKLLIANRGEIAVRIARTAHRMGIGTVGVYSEPDRNALHVDCVDTAVALGGATAAESYLRADAIIDAATSTGCDAIHPGYGFLAENAEFAQQVMNAGLVWVGPTPENISLLGDKVAAKQAALDAGVPTARSLAASVDNVPADAPMPALVKAAAGGGGRGMRIVRDPADLSEAIAAASREATAAFGDGTVFIEPYLEHGRHIEVQIIGDAHGNVIHLGERECSIQRRNQKVVEEAPSAGISDEVRQALLAGALALAGHMGYENAGTVEFLVGADGTINFLEVNTRLQVEHPVTEAVTGLDLVELQLLVAAGLPLPVTQDDVVINGHAIEVRVVAENPAIGWLPSTGEVQVFHIGPHVRVDTGFRAGAEVSPNYDSLLAKVIAHAPDRQRAAKQLGRALRTSQVVGVNTNLDTLAAIMAEPDYLAAATPTSYLDAHPEVLAGAMPQDDDLATLMLAATFALEQLDRSANPHTGFAPSGWRNLRIQGERRTWAAGHDPNTSHQVEYVLDDLHASVLLGPWPEPTDEGTLPEDTRRQATVRLLERSAENQTIELDGRRQRVHTTVTVHAGQRSVHTRSSTGAVTWIEPPRYVEHSAQDMGGGPISPLPGTVLAVHVEPGQTVAEGDLLVVVEAMKMEHKITAPAAATVGTVHFAAGDRVDSGDLLVSLEPIDA